MQIYIQPTRRADHISQIWVRQLEQAMNKPCILMNCRNKDSNESYWLQK